MLRFGRNSYYMVIKKKRNTCACRSNVGNLFAIFSLFRNKCYLSNKHAVEQRSLPFEAKWRGQPLHLGGNLLLC